MKRRVIGIGGLFFKSGDPEKLKKWYADHLGIKTDQYGGIFAWRAAEGNDELRTTVWSPFAEHTKYYEPSSREFMVNYRVENLEELLTELKKEGIQPVGDMDVNEFGKFAWIMDPDGTKLELWEPADKAMMSPVLNKSE